jgi:hypothetical protein
VWFRRVERANGGHYGALCCKRLPQTVHAETGADGAPDLLLHPLPTSGVVAEQLRDDEPGQVRAAYSSQPALESLGSAGGTRHAFRKPNTGRYVIARYRTKDTTDMAWNRIRRQVTRDIDTVIQNIREEILNTALTDAWEKYSDALSQGKVLELEAEYEATAGIWVTSQVKAVLPDALPQK